MKVKPASRSRRTIPKKPTYQKPMVETRVPTIRDKVRFNRPLTRAEETREMVDFLTGSRAHREKNNRKPKPLPRSLGSGK